MSSLEMVWRMIDVWPMSIAQTPNHVASQAAVAANHDVSTLARDYPRGAHLALHAHREAQLLFAARGVMQVTTPKGRWFVPPQRAVWLPPQIEHSVDMLGELEMRTLYVAPGWLRTHPEAKRLGREFVVVVGPLLRAVMLALSSGPDLRRTELLAQLALFELAEAEDAMTFVPMPADLRARRVANLVLADPSGGLELEDLARAAGVSQRTITRLFPAETTLTFKTWRQRARIMKAVEALGSGEGPIKRVSARLGFSSVAAFGYAFRQVMGMTPGEFLDQSSRNG